MEDLGIETWWLAHGTLLGHYWGQKILPWDVDIDVQMPMTSLRYLATGYNSTRYQYGGSIYLLDINPHYSIVSTADVSNKIDARWIDMNNGKYIDITSVHQNESNPRLLFCKDHHQYSVSLLFTFYVTYESKVIVSSQTKSIRFSRLFSKVWKSIYQSKQRIFSQRNMAKTHL